MGKALTLRIALRLEVVLSVYAERRSVCKCSLLAMLA